MEAPIAISTRCPQNDGLGRHREASKRLAAIRSKIAQRTGANCGAQRQEEEEEEATQYHSNSLAALQMRLQAEERILFNNQKAISVDKPAASKMHEQLEQAKKFSKSVSPIMTLVVVVILLIFSSAAILPIAHVDCAKLPDIYWNSSNPIFRIDNTDHIIDVNKKQHDHDQVDLVCPQAAPSSSSSGQQQQVASSPAATGENNKTLRPGGDLLQQERYIIYSVSKDEYDTCRLNGPSARVVAVCDQPQRPRPPITITFRSFTPQPNGLEFKPGQDYYFITALHGHQADPTRRFSPCRDQNMKVTFKICCKSPGTPSASATPAGPVRPQPPTKQQQQPPAAAVVVSPPSQPRPPVMTIRPTFKTPASSQSPLGNYFGSLADSQFNQQQQQPVTVLPIEDIQPPSEPPNSNSPAGDNQDSPSSPATDFQNEQPFHLNQQAPPAAPLRDLIAESVRDQTQTQVGHQPQPPPILPFDPSAPPAFLRDKWAGRWQPTPLPGHLRPSAPEVMTPPASIASVQSKPAPWELPPPAQQPGGRGSQFAPNRQPQASQHLPMAPSAEQPRNRAPSRSELYQWQQQFTSSEPQIDPYSRGTQLVTAPSPDQQTGAGSATGAPTFAVALLVPLLALAILLALGLERRLR